MQSTEATRQASKSSDKPTVNPNLIALLALRQHRLDRALGIRRVTPQVASLLNAYNKLVRQNVQRVVNASIVHALLGKNQARMLEIMAEVREADSEHKRKLLTEAEKLQAQTERYVRALEKTRTALS